MTHLSPTHTTSQPTDDPAAPPSRNDPGGTPPDSLLKTLDYSVLQQCMHCGMCLPTCPTYDETKRERSSPRGRIRLMREVADDRLAISDGFAEEMSYCLGCLACQSACPAGVDYATLLETARAEVERERRGGWGRRLLRWGTMSLLIGQPWLLRAAGRCLWLFQRSGMQGALRRSGLTRLLPGRLRDLEGKTPTIRPPFSHQRIRTVESPREVKYRVALLTGCVQDLLYARINRASADVLLANGCEVLTPHPQSCCGSLGAHNGELAAARELARENIDSFEVDSLDAIITNAGGCGSHLRHYHQLLADDPDYRDRAAIWDEKVRDISEWLVEIDFHRPQSPETGKETLVTYDASCHLLHGQKIARQPLRVLRAIPGIRLVDLPEADWCCGSAGVYSLTQPEQSQKLLERKLNHIAATGADILATGNPGCLMQLETGAASDPRLRELRICHPVELLAEAYQAESARAPAGS